MDYVCGSSGRVPTGLAKMRPQVQNSNAAKKIKANRIK